MTVPYLSDARNELEYEADFWQRKLSSQISAIGTSSVLFWGNSYYLRTMRDENLCDFQIFIVSFLNTFVRSESYSPRRNGLVTDKVESCLIDSFSSYYRSVMRLRDMHEHLDSDSVYLSAVIHSDDIAAMSSFFSKELSPYRSLVDSAVASNLDALIERFAVLAANSLGRNGVVKPSSFMISSGKGISDLFLSLASSKVCGNPPLNGCSFNWAKPLFSASPILKLDGSCFCFAPQIVFPQLIDVVRTAVSRSGSQYALEWRQINHSMTEPVPDDSEASKVTVAGEVNLQTDDDLDDPPLDYPEDASEEFDHFRPQMEESEVFSDPEPRTDDAEISEPLSNDEDDELMQPSLFDEDDSFSDETEFAEDDASDEENDDEDGLYDEIEDESDSKDDSEYESEVETADLYDDIEEETDRIDKVSQDDEEDNEASTEEQPEPESDEKKEDIVSVQHEVPEAPNLGIVVESSEENTESEKDDLDSDTEETDLLIEDDDSSNDLEEKSNLQPTLEALEPLVDEPCMLQDGESSEKTCSKIMRRIGIESRPSILMSSWFDRLSKEESVEISFKIEAAIEANSKDGKEKMFSISSQAVSFCIVNPNQDSLARMEMENSIAAVMLVNERTSWNAFVIKSDEEIKLVSIKKADFQPRRWKLVQQMGWRLYLQTKAAGKDE